MAKLFGLIQADYIYDLHWTEKEDTIFIDALLVEQPDGNFSPFHANEYAVRVAMDVVNKGLKKSFTFDDCMGRVELLSKRHRVFSWVIRKHGVRYDATSNRIYALDHIWDVMFKWNEFSLAYQHFGDPKWSTLHQLFNTDDSPGMYNKLEVIEVSSDESEVKKIVEVAKEPVAKEGKAKNLPAPTNYRDAKTKEGGSWGSWTRSYCKLLDQFPSSQSDSSEPSVNQPLPGSSSFNPVHDKWLALNPPKMLRFSRTADPSLAKSVGIAGSSCPGPH